ncbi:hypothetical protein EG68_05171 [Paragonimus skrjabini miyazakii]|uniref:Uncharacterized protein n=1 Tax=Paragonimus skrjabini miyazakii TaxID=59628 RepID=A0A8S9YYJ9_9TREM|nr:hypothetical protein EG68_05171 [Paragonimus skrjabini miyazakii]
MTNLSDDFSDRIHDELLGVQLFPSIQDDSSKRLSAEALVRGYKKFCQRKRIRVRDPVVTRIRNVCHHLLFDLRELDLSSQEFEAIVHILQDCARIAIINLSFNRIENKGIKLLRLVAVNGPFLTQLRKSNLVFELSHLFTLQMIEIVQCTILIISPVLEERMPFLLRCCVRDHRTRVDLYFNKLLSSCFPQSRRSLMPIGKTVRIPGAVFLLILWVESHQMGVVASINQPAVQPAALQHAVDLILDGIDNNLNPPGNETWSVMSSA